MDIVPLLPQSGTRNELLKILRPDADGGNHPVIGRVGARRKSKQFASMRPICVSPGVAVVRRPEASPESPAGPVDEASDCGDDERR